MLHLGCSGGLGKRYRESPGTESLAAVGKEAPLQQYIQFFLKMNSMMADPAAFQFIEGFQFAAHVQRGVESNLQN